MSLLADTVPPFRLNPWLLELDSGNAWKVDPSLGCCEDQLRLMTTKILSKVLGIKKLTIFYISTIGNMLRLEGQGWIQISGWQLETFWITSLVKMERGGCRPRRTSQLSSFGFYDDLTHQESYLRLALLLLSMIYHYTQDQLESAAVLRRAEERLPEIKEATLPKL